MRGTGLWWHCKLCTAGKWIAAQIHVIAVTGICTPVPRITDPMLQPTELSPSTPACMYEINSNGELSFYQLTFTKWKPSYECGFCCYLQCFLLTSQKWCIFSYSQYITRHVNNNTTFHLPQKVSWNNEWPSPRKIDFQSAFPSLYPKFHGPMPIIAVIHHTNYRAWRSQQARWALKPLLSQTSHWTCVNVNCGTLVLYNSIYSVTSSSEISLRPWCSRGCVPGALVPWCWNGPL